MTSLGCKLVPLFVLAFLQGASAAGVQDVFRREGPGVWSTDFYARLLGRNAFRKSYAVIVGVGNYDHFPRLSAPATDAMLVRDFLLREAGFDEIFTLTDDKATYSRLTELMEKIIPEAIGPNDRFLFYFSGHGVTRSLATTKRGYLVLKNSQRGNWHDMIDMDRMKQWSENVAQARHTLFLLDACFSGLAAYEAKTGIVREKTLARLMQPGHHIVTAGTEGEETFIYKGQSLFTQAFLSAARGDGMAVDDGIVSLNEMMARVNRILDAKQAEIGDRIRMTPRQYHARITNNAGEFFFLPRSAPATITLTAPGAPAAPPVPKSAVDTIAAVNTVSPPERQAVPPPVELGRFTFRSGVEASGVNAESYSDVSIGACEQRCSQSRACKVFTYLRGLRICYLYERAWLASNESFDTGIRDLTAIEERRPVAAAVSRLFTIRRGVEASGVNAESYPNVSISACEQRCSQSPACKVFTYLRGLGICYLYRRAWLASNESFDTGIRDLTAIEQR